MAAATCEFTYQEETFTVGYDYTASPVEGTEQVKHTFTILDESDVLFTITRYGIINNIYLAVKELIDAYNAYSILENKAEALKTDFEDSEGNLDTFLDENPIGYLL